MECRDVRAELFLGADEVDPAVGEHVAACPDCSSYAARARVFEADLRATLVVEPPRDLQLQLEQIAREAARPAEAPALVPAPAAVPATAPPRPRLLRPNLLIAQLVAVLTVALATWQVFVAAQSLPSAVRDAVYGLQVLMASPIGEFVGEAVRGNQMLLVWLAVGLAAWMISDSGPLGRRLSNNPTAS